MFRSDSVSQDEYIYVIRPGLCFIATAVCQMSDKLPCNILDKGIANSKYTSIIERPAAYLLIGKFIIHHPKEMNIYKIYTYSVL